MPIPVQLDLTRNTTTSTTLSDIRSLSNRSIGNCNADNETCDSTEDPTGLQGIDIEPEVNNMDLDIGEIDKFRFGSSDSCSFGSLDDDSSSGCNKESEKGGETEHISKELAAIKAKWLSNSNMSSNHTGPTTADSSVTANSNADSSEADNDIDKTENDRAEMPTSDDFEEKKSSEDELPTDENNTAEKSDGKTMPSDDGDDESVSNELTALQEQACRKNSTNDETADCSQTISNELTGDRVKWLEEQAFKKKVEEKNAETISNELTGDKVKWLQEEAFKKKQDSSDCDEDVEPISNELTGDKVKWLQEQAFKKKANGENEEISRKISNESTNDKVKWLQEQAFKKNNEKETIESMEPISNDLTGDRVKWLQEQAFQKSTKSNDNANVDPISKELTGDKIKWLQEEAFRGKSSDEEGGDVQEITNELTTDKVKWLQEEAFRNNNDQGGDEEQISNELTSDKVKWLQEQAFKNKSNDDEEGDGQPISNELTTDKVKWIQEEAFKTIDDTEGEQEQISDELTTDKVRWLENAFENDNVQMDKTTIEDTEERENGSDGDSDSESDNQSQQSSTKQVDDSAPDEDGADTDDLYALLAYSKGRLKGRSMEEPSDESDIEVSNQSNKSEPKQPDSDNATAEDAIDRNADEDLSVASSVVSHESVDGDDVAIGSSTDEVPQDKDSPEQHLSIRDYKKQQQQKETQELWALLNYSKVRLVTGSTPSASEARALGMTEENAIGSGLSFDDTTVDGGKATDENDTMKNNGEDEDEEGDETSTLDDSMMTEGDSDSNDGEEDDDDITKEDVAAARARAMAALARTTVMYGELEEVDESYIAPIMSTVSPSKRDDILTEEQMLKSMALAEEASLKGESVFDTASKIPILDTIATPTNSPPKGMRKWKAMVPEERFSLGKVRSRVRGRDRAPSDGVKSFASRAREFFATSKQKAEESIQEMRENLEAMEKKNARNHDPHSGGFKLKKNSPLKKFADNVTKVEMMHEMRYGDGR